MRGLTMNYERHMEHGAMLQRMRHNPGTGCHLCTIGRDDIFQHNIINN